MADHIAAEIKIGGQIPVALVGRLCQAISREQLSLDWGDAVFSPYDAGELLNGRCEIDGIHVLRLCDDEARYGEFAELEKFLRNHDIPFDRFHDGKYEIEPSLLQFRPGSGYREFAATSCGAILIRLDSVLAIRESIASARQDFSTGQMNQAADKLKAAFDSLDDCLAEPASLPALEIVNGGQSA